jgi:hypothetical protein
LIDNVTQRVRSYQKVNYKNNQSKALAGFQCQSLPQTASELQGFLQRLSMQAGKKNEFLIRKYYSFQIKF